MKSIIILFALSFLFAITTAKGTVLDTDGYPVRNGDAYYILPVFTKDNPDIGGGISILKTGDDICALTIVQSPFKDDNGIPTIIESSSLDSNIKEGVPLNLTFSANDVPSCSPVPSRWSIVYESGNYFVKLTDAHSIKERSEFFYIENVNYNNYKLSFISFNTRARGDIGIYIDDHRINRLVLLSEKTNFLVQFQLANSSLAARRMKEGKIELPHSG